MNDKDKRYIESLIGDTSRKMPDYDGDGYPDLFDCDPFDPTKDGLIGESWARMTAAVQTARRRIYRPAAVSGREAVSAVYRRAYGVGAAARAAAATRISRAREFVRAPPAERARRTEVGKEAFIRARKPQQISDMSRRIHEETARVAKVARGFEKQVDPYARDVERALGFHKTAIPQPVRWTGEQVKQLGYGVAFHAPAAAVEIAGMVPGGVETIARKPSIVPAAAALGLFEMGRGTWHGMTTAPGRTIGELVGVAAISKGMPKVPFPKRATRAFPTSEPAPKGLAPGKQIKFEAGLEVAQKLAKVEAPIKRPLDFGEIATLPRGSGKAVETWIKTHPDQKAVIFGSASVRTQLKTSRTPVDLDVFVKDPTIAAKQVGAVLTKKLGAANVRVKGAMVETRVKGKWDHAVDFHSRTEMTGRMTLGFETQKPIEIGGIKYTRVGEQLTRKAASILQQKGRTIGPPEHRTAKDIGDFMDISGQMIESRASAAQKSWLLSEYKTRKVEHLKAMRHEYEIHSYIAPEVTPAIRGYYGLPRSVRAPGYIVAAVGVGAKYPKPTYPVAKYPGVAKYPTAKYPVAAEYPLTKYPPGHEPYKPPYKPRTPYAPVTKYPPTTPPYTPPYTPTTEYVPAVPPYTPPYTPSRVVPKVIPPLRPPTKPPVIRPKKKDKKKIKKREAMPEMAIGWKQKHELILLKDLFGYSP